MKTLNLNKTALVIIDLQKGIAGREGFAPYSAQDVLAKNKELVTSLKNTEALIVFVHVKNYGEEALKPKTDNPPLAHGQIPADFSDFVMPEAYDKDYDNVIHVAKHNWGASYGTDLDVQLLRRGIEEIVLSGIATTIGCDTTAREAFQHGYQVIAVEDAMTDFNGSLHKGIVDGIFTRLGRVRSTQEVVKMIEESK
ncbi:isochorismatase family protein [Lactococcus cremoris]|nr:isochorismatase family protein [Lactococcus cremoris]ARE23153.1 isochorismatase family protein [Lactococcus cremoris]MCT4408644.1 isochorismatase family protein [Lactococcus cremoris]MCT4422376.1 isochorismatase family protein [Lactococcus cremoris]MCT4425685.1 isochorismatase family protein [Lactococcus cremoris]MRM44001.1 isochorismatase family protein [Lactococcus cremoris]